MQTLPNQLYTIAQVRKLDRMFIDSGAVTGYELMQRAAAAAYQYLRQTWSRAQRIAVFAGVGNNAGDGYVLARLAHSDGFKVQLIQIGDVKRVQGDALTAYQALLDTGCVPHGLAQFDPSDSDLIVDAIFGTGLDRVLTGEWLAAVDQINSAKLPVLALDIPSGLNADTGAVMGSAVHANATVTFIGLKRGLFTGDAPAYCGLVRYAALQMPEQMLQAIQPDATLLDKTIMKRCLPPRLPTAHKGQCGHVLIIGGAPGYSGAVQLAGLAALRAGAGLVSVLIPELTKNALCAVAPELMVHGFDTLLHANELDALLQRADVIAIGPGLGQTDWARKLFNKVCLLDKPLIVDADALNILAQTPCQRAQWILTPHPGEAGRLLNTTTREIQCDRFAAIEALVKKYNANVVLKGAGSLISGPDGQTSVCIVGNPGMATGGTGDILTGVIAAIVGQTRAQNITLNQASQLAVFAHASAGDRAAGINPRGLIATDLLDSIRTLVNLQ